MGQAALRDLRDPVQAAVIEAIETRETVTVELLDRDQAGSAPIRPAASARSVASR
jgi:hypothetical protein